MNKIIITISIVLSSQLAGCGISSAIQPAKTSESGFSGAVYSGETNSIATPTQGEEQFRIFHQAATGFVSVQSIRNSAEARALTFCQRKNKTLNITEETVSTPPYMLGNFPRIELIFECISV